MDYLWISKTPRTTNLFLRLVLLKLFHLCQLHESYRLAHQYVKLPPFDLLEHAIQVFNGFYEWPAMMRRMSKYYFLSDSVPVAPKLLLQDMP